MNRAHEILTVTFQNVPPFALLIISIATPLTLGLFKLYSVLRSVGLGQ